MCHIKKVLLHFPAYLAGRHLTLNVFARSEKMKHQRDYVCVVKRTHVRRTLMDCYVRTKYASRLADL